MFRINKRLIKISASVLSAFGIDPDGRFDAEFFADGIRLVPSRSGLFRVAYSGPSRGFQLNSASLCRSIRARFAGCDNPNLVLIFELHNHRMKLTKEYLAQYALERGNGQSETFVNVSRNGQLNFSSAFERKYLQPNPAQKTIGFEIDESTGVISLRVGADEEYKVLMHGDYTAKAKIQNRALSGFLYDHFSQDKAKRQSFRLYVVSETDKGLVMSLKK